MELLKNNSYYTPLIHLFESFKIFPQTNQSKEQVLENLSKTMQESSVLTADPLIGKLVDVALNNREYSLQIIRNALPVYNLDAVILALYQPQSIFSTKTPILDLSSHHSMSDIDLNTTYQFFRLFSDELIALVKQHIPQQFTPQIAQILQDYQSLQCKVATPVFFAAVRSSCAETC